MEFNYFLSLYICLLLRTYAKYTAYLTAVTPNKESHKYSNFNMTNIYTVVILSQDDFNFSSTFTFCFFHTVY